MGCRVLNSGLKVSGLRFRDGLGLGFRVKGAGCRVQSLWIRVRGLRFRIRGLRRKVKVNGFQVQGYWV